MAIPAIILSIGSAGAGASLKLLEHPIGAWLLILVLIAMDAGIGAVISFNQGITGTLFSFMLDFLGLKGITIYAWQLLILIAFFPVIMYVVNSSASN